MHALKLCVSKTFVCACVCYCKAFVACPQLLGCRLGSIAHPQCQPRPRCYDGGGGDGGGDGDVLVLVVVMVVT